MLDGTPVLDIKPLTSSIPPETLHRGWLEEAEQRNILQAKPGFNG
jgi:tRNA (Thr-GGU) A37 N-methylase